jgi:carboxyl-terminal processing protease
MKALKICALLLLMLVVISPKGLWAQKSGEDPGKAFERFWKIMDENYAFFKLKDVKWQAVYNDYRPKVNKSATDQELFDLLVEILKTFDDAHISLSVPANKELRYSGNKMVLFEKEFSTDSLITAYFSMVENTLTNLGFQDIKQKGPVLNEKNPVYNHTVFEYAANVDYGYIKVSWFFYDWAKLAPLSIRRDRKKFQKGFSDILNQFDNKKALILDLRNNIGGVSGHPEALAGFFTADKYIGEYTSHRKKGNHESFSKLKPTYVKPVSDKPFTKPVILLVNGRSVSACEEFVMMMRSLPNVTIVGMPTQGALSDIFSAKLPNGWILGLSNMRFYSPEMVCYENIGIPVDIEAGNTINDLKTGNDPLLLKAIDILKDNK